ncbi:hypothetical protein ACFOWE_26140 [Planomonospora corallina]|uniref:Uncharacterized protein n=1 Tax=Planomonospora corallina TaxID=1806052 RepID=A0ABV8IH72_9ACTN
MRDRDDQVPEPPARPNGGRAGASGSGDGRPSGSGPRADRAGRAGRAPYGRHSSPAGDRQGDDTPVTCEPLVRPGGDQWRFREGWTAGRDDDERASRPVQVWYGTPPRVRIRDRRPYPYALAGAVVATAALVVVMTADVGTRGGAARVGTTPAATSAAPRHDRTAGAPGSVAAPTAAPLADDRPDQGASGGPRARTRPDGERRPVAGRDGGGGDGVSRYGGYGDLPKLDGGVWRVPPPLRAGPVRPSTGTGRSSSPRPTGGSTGGAVSGPGPGAATPAGEDGPRGRDPGDRRPPQQRPHPGAGPGPEWFDDDPCDHYRPFQRPFCDSLLQPGRR